MTKITVNDPKPISRLAKIEKKLMTHADKMQDKTSLPSKVEVSSLPRRAVNKWFISFMTSPRIGR